MGMGNFAGRHSAVSRAKTAEPIQMPFCSGFELNEPIIIRWGPDLPMRWSNILGERRRHSNAVSCAKMAKPIEMPFGLWTQVG